jgi:branched-chain amino acid aminotransferase
VEQWGSALPDSPGSANLKWGELGFDYHPTNGHVRHVHKAGHWDQGVFQRDPFISVHILGNVFHYGQALFEGFKVYHTKNGDVCSFVDGECWKRMQHGCTRFRMPVVPKSVWEDAIDEVVRQNVAFVPPYGSGGALYVRPFMFGSGPRLGLGPSTEYTFIVFANPTGSYYQTGQLDSLDALIQDDFDRAAPLGCGDCKAAGNYAADLDSMVDAKRKGFPISLYLDSKERRYIEEFNTSNFVAITKDGRYLTPNEPRSVLRGNTNAVLRQLATDMGLKVEMRRIDFEEEVDSFAEVGAVGTAVVVTPIQSFTRGDRVWKFQQPNVIKELHDKVRAIQQGDAEDSHGWMRKIRLNSDTPPGMLSIYPAL